MEEREITDNLLGIEEFKIKELLRLNKEVMIERKNAYMFLNKKLSKKSVLKNKMAKPIKMRMKVRK